MSWCWWPGLTLVQHCKSQCMHCRKSVPVLIWPDVLLGWKTPVNMNKQAWSPHSNNEAELLQLRVSAQMR